MKIIDKLKNHIKMPVNTKVTESREFLNIWALSFRGLAQFPTLSTTKAKPTQIISEAELKRNEKKNTPQYSKLKVAELRSLESSHRPEWETGFNKINYTASSVELLS